MTTSTTNIACSNLVLDAGPLLMLSPLRGLAGTFLTVPQVLEELKDKRAREHFEKLGLIAGVNIRVQSPDSESLAHVTQFAKKTGDYSALSHADLCVLALTYALDKAEKGKPPGERSGKSADATPPDRQIPSIAEDVTPSCERDNVEWKGSEDAHYPQGDTRTLDDAIDSLGEAVGRLEVELVSLNEDCQVETGTTVTKDAPHSHDSEPPQAGVSQPLRPLSFEDPVDDDDGEGEWITPENVSLYKARALGLTPSDHNFTSAKDKEIIPVGCMTADFAMQNVLLQMGLSLVGMEGKKIQKVKTWVLRCHACFKICKDASKKFCPSCGNPALLRASVTISSPSASSDAPPMQVHLKKNFQYRTRGTIYSIPAPKPGSAKTGCGEGLILREDQTEYMRATKRAETQRLRDDKKLLSGALANGGEGKLGVGSWLDPDWIPEIMTAGKGRSLKQGDGMPTIGYGKRNPNERKRRK
ncbi:Nin one binding Zn-ribbon like-domain-containing protein [Lactarius vividus]|nr:Nin one binding Zn-ribbon like-domain-containing protein [Lactarius vividus]